MLHGRYAVITGAGQGLGAVIAERYVAAGASVLLCARTAQTLEAVRDRLAPDLRDGQKLEIMRADVAVPADMDALIARGLAVFPHLDILVNNAGVYGPMGAIEEIDWTEWADSIAVNLLGTVYACRAVMAHFKARRYGKIVNLSGGGATSPLPGLSAYAAAKAGVVRFTETLALEGKEYGVDVNAIAPGVLMTRLTEELIAAGPEKIGAGLYARIAKMHADGGTPLTLGADLAVYLGAAVSDGVSGRLIAAQWDPWETLHAHKDDLEGTDIYTLRRILPKERGQTWGKD